jgi:predicted negative regulator of RcsB-dependent stress response
VASGEWFRSAAWDLNAKADFEARLARARRNNRPQYLTIKALALQESGHDVDAVELLRRVVEEYPNSLDAVYSAERLGDHYLASGDPAAAERHYRRSMELRPDLNATTGEVHIGLAEALIAQERYDEALHALEHLPVTRLTLNHAVCRWNAALADAALGVGDRGLAREAAGHALALLDAPDQFARHPGVGRAALTDEQQTRLRAIAAGRHAGRSTARRGSLRRQWVPSVSWRLARAVHARVMPFGSRKRIEPARDPDTELVDGATGPLWDVYLASPERLTPEQATLMDVWSTVGAVGNGGLPHFIETGGHRGREVASAFRVIGIDAYATVIERTLRLYPTAGCPDPDGRLSACGEWQDGGSEERELDELDRKAQRISADRAVERALAAFVRRHSEQFGEERARERAPHPG